MRQQRWMSKSRGVGGSRDAAVMCVSRMLEGPKSKVQGPKSDMDQAGKSKQGCGLVWSISGGKMERFLEIFLGDGIEQEQTEAAEQLKRG